MRSLSWIWLIYINILNICWNIQNWWKNTWWSPYNLSFYRVWISLKKLSLTTNSKSSCRVDRDNRASFFRSISTSDSDSITNNQIMLTWQSDIISLVRNINQTERLDSICWGNIKQPVFRCIVSWFCTEWLQKNIITLWIVFCSRIND